MFKRDQTYNVLIKWFSTVFFTVLDGPNRMHLIVKDYAHSKIRDFTVPLPTRSGSSKPGGDAVVTDIELSDDSIFILAYGSNLHEIKLESGVHRYVHLFNDEMGFMEPNLSNKWIQCDLVSMESMKSDLDCDSHFGVHWIGQFLEESIKGRSFRPHRNKLLTSSGTDLYAAVDRNIFSIVENVAGDIRVVGQIEERHGKIVQLAAGKNFFLVLDAAGNVYSYGCGSHGELGDGTVSVNSRPLSKIDIFDCLFIRTISCGSFHAAALTSSGDLYVWGWNTMGQLGIQTSDSSMEETPHLVEQFEDVLDVQCSSLATVVRCATDLLTSTSGEEKTSNDYKKPTVAEEKSLKAFDRSDNSTSLSKTHLFMAGQLVKGSDVNAKLVEKACFKPFIKPPEEKKFQQPADNLVWKRIDTHKLIASNEEFNDYQAEYWTVCLF